MGEIYSCVRVLDHGLGLGNVLRDWLNGRAQEFLKRIGLKRGQRVLDFGCGRGNYTIPAAQVVGNEGRVYALDKNPPALDELMRRAAARDLDNIVRMDTSGEVDIDLDDSSVQVVLLYDIFWYFRLHDQRLPRLLDEVIRVSTPDGFVSIYPKHIDDDMLLELVQSRGYRMRDSYSGELLHDGYLERGKVYNFTLPSR
jgi:ubiquinone/menaquinone biosynthesis C-methylase UbiE